MNHWRTPQVAIAIWAALQCTPLSRAQTMEVVQHPSAIVVKDANRRTLTSIPLGKDDRFFEGVSSLDKRFAFIPLAKRRGAASLKVVDLATGSVFSRDLAGQPFRLLRAGPNRTLWIVGNQMQSISETGDPGDPFPLDFDGGAVAAGAVVSAGNCLAFSLVRGPKLLYRVGVIDLRLRRVVGVEATRGTSQSAKLAIRHQAKDLLKSVGFTLATAGLMDVHVHTTYFDYFIVARPDGRYVYAIDFGTHEVSVIDGASGAKVKTLHLDQSISRAQGSPDGRKLVLTGKITQMIDLDSNEIER